MLKKFYKKDFTEEIIMKIPPKLVGGAFFYGKIGAGKTTAMMAVAQKYHDIFGYKIFDIHGGQRNENLYWTIPSDEINYWDYIKKKFSIKENQEGPKQYKVNLLYPYFGSKMPNKLPNNSPYVKSKIFTIPIKDVKLDDVKLVINNVSETASYIWRESVENLTNKDGGPEFSEFAKKNGGESQIIYKNVIKPLVKEQFLQNKNNSYNLDILQELRDKETISVLCLNHIPPIYHLFIIGYILRKTKEFLDAGKTHKKNIFIFREAGEYFRVKDDSVTDNRIKWFRKLLTDSIRYGRRGMHMFMDTQSPAETRGICEDASDLTFLGKVSTTSIDDRKVISEYLK